MKKINLRKHYTVFMKQWYKVNVHYMETTTIVLTRNIESSTLVWHYIS